MDLSNLKPAVGSTKKRKRIGRGQGSGHGGTSTRGHKGVGSRSGYKSKGGFEGGQMPMARRLPKVGFYSMNRVEYVSVNLDMLQRLSEEHNITKFDSDTFRKHGIANKTDLVKILGRGELKSKLEVSANAFSATAQKAIEAAGGTVSKV